MQGTLGADSELWTPVGRQAQAQAVLCLHFSQQEGFVKNNLKLRNFHAPELTNTERTVRITNISPVVLGRRIYVLA